MVLFLDLKGDIVITYEQYVGKWDTSSDVTGNIEFNIRNRLLPIINDLCDYISSCEVDFPINPITKSLISGTSLGGFRPQTCTIGAPKSNHKQGLAVDIYDPKGEIDAWCMTNKTTLAEFGVWLEHPDATPGWCHMQVVPPRSGSRVFKP